MQKVLFLTTPDAAPGFAMSGTMQRIAENGSAEDILREVMADRGIGLVVIDERLLQGMPADRLRELERGWHGIFLVLPSPEKAPPEVEDYAARLIRQAVGYHVRLNF